MSTFSEKSSDAKQSAKKFFRKLIAIIVVLFIGVMLFIYYANISEGTRAGMVVKISKRGAIFKTYEGQLDLGSFGAVNDQNQLSQIFKFSVEKGNDEIYRKLEEASLSGERVQVRYKEKYAVLPWRAETTYFVYEVIESGKKQQKKELLEN
jgi:hypothetical protein